MGTRLKSKTSKYINQIWLIEIIILLIISFYLGVDIYKSTTIPNTSKLLSSVEATIDAKSFYKDEFQKDTNKLTEEIYNNNFLQYTGYNEFRSISETQNVYIPTTSNKSNAILFILRNKGSNKIITNDDDYFNADSISDIDIDRYIREKFNGKEIMISFDNNNVFNPLAEVNNIYDKELLGKYEEYYYTTVDNYYTKADLRTTFLAFILAIIFFFLLFKILAIFIINKGRLKLRGNFIYSIFYVLKFGFKYRHTRRTLMTSIVGSIMFFILYLYLLAIGGYENNILVTFVSRYPFKGSFMLMSLPMIGIIYSIKKTIDISLINDELKEINEGNLAYKITEHGSDEIRELIKNIIRIKDGYEIAVGEALRDEKVKTQLITNVSHDLRTPLTSIINYVNILGDDRLTEEERRDYIKILDQKSKKLKILIDDLFEMSKINSGRLELNKERIDIMSLIHQAIGEYSYLYENKKIEFNVESFNEEIYMLLDGKMMSRALENVVINALKYSLDNTRIYVEIKEDDEYIKIAFKNISNYKMDFDDEEIFQRFARGDKSRNSNIEGSGLGLAITKSIIELHDGQVIINREGDMFRIYFKLPKGKN